MTIESGITMRCNNYILNVGLKCAFLILHMALIVFENSIPVNRMK